MQHLLSCATGVAVASRARAFLTILDETHTVTMADLRGTAKLPTPIH